MLRSLKNAWTLVLACLTLSVVPSLVVAARPNIVLFISDDHGVLDSGPYGNSVVRTPHLDRLAAESMTFQRAFAGSPTCSPSRSVIYTGLMPMRNGAHANHSGVKPGTRSLPHYLKELGYRVALAGKIHVKPRAEFPFEYVPDSSVPEPGTDGRLRHDLNTKAVDAFLDDVASDRPFCLVVASHSPHVIWPENATYDPATIDVPPEQIDTPELRRSRARYYTDISRMDQRLGRVLASLQRHGRSDNTMFVYTSDQGPQWPFAKWTVYDAGIRVPLLIRWPGQVRPGSTSDAIISLADLLPTFIEACGGTVAEGLDGRSFLGVLRGETDTHGDAIFASHTGDGRMNRSPARCIRTAQFKYILNLAPQLRYTTHMDKAKDHDGGREYWDSWIAAAQQNPADADKLRRYHYHPREELYDVLADPHELRNLAQDPAQAELLGGLRRRLAQWRKQQGDDKRGPGPLPQ